MKYFRTKINCEKLQSFFALVLHPTFLQMILSLNISVGFSYCIDTCYGKVIQAPTILFRKSNYFDLQK